eukprot:3706686-Lingulodinium_polyedra.AAC.1
MLSKASLRRSLVFKEERSSSTGKRVQLNALTWSWTQTARKDNIIWGLRRQMNNWPADYLTRRVRWIRRSSPSASSSSCAGSWCVRRPRCGHS